MLLVKVFAIMKSCNKGRMRLITATYIKDYGSSTTKKQAYCSSTKDFIMVA